MRLIIFLLTILIYSNIYAEELAEIVAVNKQTESVNSNQQCKKVPRKITVKKDKDGTTGGIIGGVGGAVAGGIIGNQVSHSGGSIVGAALGATGGAIAGNKIQKAKQADYETRTVYQKVCSNKANNQPQSNATYKISYIYKNIPGNLISTKAYNLGSKVKLQDLQASASTK